jgi:AAA ATPase domain
LVTATFNPTKSVYPLADANNNTTTVSPLSGLADFVLNTLVAILRTSAQNISTEDWSLTGIPGCIAMKLEHVSVKNFRVVDEVEFDLGPVANIICGPNATGKSSILEAIRLVKAVVAPRVQNETQQVLIQLQAVSPHFPQQINIAALAGDATKPCTIETVYKLDDDEITALPSLKAQLGDSLVSAEMANRTNSQVDLVQFYATPAGAALRQQAHQKVDSDLGKLISSRRITLRVQIDSQRTCLRRALAKS